MRDEWEDFDGLKVLWGGRQQTNLFLSIHLWSRWAYSVKQSPRNGWTSACEFLHAAVVPTPRTIGPLRRTTLYSHTTQLRVESFVFEEAECRQGRIKQRQYIKSQPLLSYKTARRARVEIRECRPRSAVDVLVIIWRFPR